MTTACLPHQITVCTVTAPGRIECKCVGPELPLICQAPSVPVNGRCVEECTVVIKYTHPLHPEVTASPGCSAGVVELAISIVLARFLGAP